METFKAFTFIYAIFTLILILTGSITGVSIFPELETPSTFSIENVINFAGTLFNFVITLLFYSTEFFIINVILWSYRIVCIFELATYIKSLANPLAN